MKLCKKSKFSPNFPTGNFYRYVRSPSMYTTSIKSQIGYQVIWCAMLIFRAVVRIALICFAVFRLSNIWQSRLNWKLTWIVSFAMKVSFPDWGGTPFICHQFYVSYTTLTQKRHLMAMLVSESTQSSNFREHACYCHGNALHQIVLSTKCSIRRQQINCSDCLLISFSLFSPFRTVPLLVALHAWRTIWVPQMIPTH